MPLNSGQDTSWQRFKPGDAARNAVVDHRLVMPAMGNGDIRDMMIGRGDFVAKIGYLVRRYSIVIVGMKEEERAAKISCMGHR